MADVKKSTSTTIEERVHMVIRHVLALEGDVVLEGTSRLKEDLGADSVDAVMLVMALEKEFNGEIPDDEYAGLSAVDEVVALITKHAEGSGIS